MAILSEIKRVAKPVAKLKLWFIPTLVLLNNALFLKGFLRLNIFTSQEKIIYEHLESPRDQSYSKGELKKILNGFGFKNIKIEKVKQIYSYLSLQRNMRNISFSLFFLKFILDLFLSILILLDYC